MKDLLLYVADADALAFMRSILERHRALGIRPISFDIQRHPLRDSGMVQSGAELVRMKKGEYHKALLIWDYHGSGRNHKQAPESLQAEVQNKLNGSSWKNSSAVIIIVPELERWLWFCENAVADHYAITRTTLQSWVNDRAGQMDIAADDLKKHKPKELFEYIVRDRLKRTISPRDFAEIGELASVKGLLKCDSFYSVAKVLRAWFPQDA